jgi:hypothetical protein
MSTKKNKNDANNFLFLFSSRKKERKSLQVCYRSGRKIQASRPGIIKVGSRVGKLRRSEPYPSRTLSNPKVVRVSQLALSLSKGIPVLYGNHIRRMQIVQAAGRQASRPGLSVLPGRNAPNGLNHS